MYEKHHKGKDYQWLNTVLVFDIETVVSPVQLGRLPPTFEAPSNYKDPEKIAAYIEEKRAGFVDHAPLDLDYARIDSIGLSLGTSEIFTYMVGEEWEPGKDWEMGSSSVGDPLTEVEVLRMFWSWASRAKTLSGYNIVGFDLPIIQRRSFLLGVPPGRPLYNLKPWDDAILDIMRAIYHNGYGPGVKYRSLKDVARLFGIENPLPDLSGDQYKDMDRETRKRYLENDVALTRELVARTKYHYW